MENLLMIFDKMVLDEGKSVYQDIKNIYMSIEKRIQNENLPAQSFGLYHLYPYLFSDEFPDVPLKTMNEISKASILCVDYILYYDRLMDLQNNIDRDIIFQKTYIHEYYIKILIRLFGNDKNFWNHYERYFDEYVSAVQKEQDEHFGKLSDYTYEDFKMIACGKSALAKFPVAALACLTNKESVLKELEEALDLFAQAFQLYDDLKDWKDDLLEKRYSWMLSKIIIENNFQNDIALENVANVLFEKHYDIRVLAKVNELCEESMLTARKNRNWIRYVKTFQMKVMHLMYDMLNIREVNLISSTYEIWSPQKEELQLSRQLLKKAISESIEFIKRQKENEFAELTHWMAFPHEHGYTAKEECQECKVFWLALAVNLLKQLEKVDSNHSFDFEKELETIKKLKSKTFSYGWSYAGDVPELPPDLDTLSELLKLSYYSNDNNFYLELSKSIEKMLAAGTDTFRGFSTYIIENDKLINQKSYEMSYSIFGMVPAVEVNANFAIALALHDKEKYQKVLNDIYLWICSKQKKEGYWDSTYYLGNYYAGYLTVDLCNKMGDPNEVCKLYKNYIISSQNENGSWGENNGNTLDTALAILALLKMEREESDMSQLKSILKKGICYLISARKGKAYWNSCDFMAFGTGKKAASHQMMRYRSAIITTIFITLALLKADKLLEVYINE